MTGPEIASLTASVVSVVIAVFAVILALFFYFRASDLSDSTRTAAVRIEERVRPNLRPAPRR